MDQRMRGQEWTEGNFSIHGKTSKLRINICIAIAAELSFKWWFKNRGAAPAYQLSPVWVET